MNKPAGFCLLIIVSSLCRLARSKNKSGIDVSSLSSKSSQSPQTRVPASHTKLQVVEKEDSFFNGITMNKMMRSHRSRKSKRSGKDAGIEKAARLRKVNEDYEAQIKSEKSLPQISEHSKDFDDDFRKPARSNRSDVVRIKIPQMSLVDEQRRPQTSRSQVSSEESFDSESEAEESRQADLKYHDRIHFLPDSYDDTEATRKRIGRLFDAAPSKIVPVIENCNRPAIEFFFQGEIHGEVNEAFLTEKHKLHTANLNISDRLDHENLDMCPFFDVSCCSNDEMKQLRLGFSKKLEYLERLRDFLMARYKALFELKPAEIDLIFKETSDTFIRQCVGNSPEYVRTLIDFMETNSFEYDLKADEYFKELAELTRYVSCKLCDANDNHRTFYYSRADDELRLFGDQTMAIYLIKLKLKELSLGVFSRKVALLSKLVLCKAKKVSRLEMNEEENGPIRWVQNFYRKCRGELLYLLPEHFDPDSEVFAYAATEDLNEFLAMQVSLDEFLRDKPRRLSNASISPSCRDLLLRQDSNSLNFRDNFDVVRLAEFNFAVLSRFFRFVQKHVAGRTPTRDEWRVLEETFDFNLNTFKETFEDKGLPEKLGSSPAIKATELYPFVHSVLSWEPQKASHNLSFNLSEHGLSFAFLEKFGQQLLKGLPRLGALVSLAVLALLA